MDKRRRYRTELVHNAATGILAISQLADCNDWISENPNRQVFYLYGPDFLCTPQHAGKGPIPNDENVLRPPFEFHARIGLDTEYASTVALLSRTAKDEHARVG